MASLITHPIVPLAIAVAFGRRIIPLHIAALGALLSLLPDLDVIGFRYGIPYSSPWGHRGFTHSIFFALAVAGLASLITYPRSRKNAAIFCFLFVSTVSHGVLDAFTNVGEGVAFFWPISSGRYFLPFHPVETSPLSVHRFINGRGLQILASELKWIWMPCLLFAFLCAMIRLNATRAKTEL